MNKVDSIKKVCAYVLAWLFLVTYSSSVFAVVVAVASQQNEMGNTYYEKADASLNTEEQQQNYKEALNWFEKAANNGSGEAYNSLGYMYKYGQGVKQDYKKALVYFQRASDIGNLLADCNIGVMYRDGLGLNNPSIEQALFFLNRGVTSEKEFCQAQLGLTYLYENDNAFYEKASPNSAFEKAKKYLSLAAHKGNLSSRFELAMIDIRTIDSSQVDRNKAISTIIELAEKGLPQAQATLSFFYLTGTEIEKNKKEALKWLKSAAQNNHLTSMVALGRAYEFELYGLKKDLKLARFWFQRAVDIGNPNGGLALERLKFKGQDSK